ncbi:MAG: DUF4878 domain-containing protein [Bacteroidetes bacterium]|nr:DUF4878 domain-containing protein [Bacteroidota bacterium]
MKKVLLSVAAVMMLAMTLVSCGGGGPKANAEKFLNGFYHMDYAAAKEVATDDTKKQLESYESIMGSMVQQSAKDEAKKLKIDIKEPKVNGEAATVEYTVSNDPSPKELKMVKVNGKWLAQWSKMDMGGGAGAPTEPNTGGAIDTTMAPPADAPADTAAKK